MTKSKRALSHWRFGFAVLAVAVAAAIFAAQEGTVQSQRNPVNASAMAIPGNNAEVAGWIDSIDFEKGLLTLDVGTSAVMGWPTPARVGFIVSSGSNALASLEQNQRVVVSYRKRATDLEIVAIRVDNQIGGSVNGSGSEEPGSSQSRRTSADRE